MYYMPLVRNKNTLFGNIRTKSIIFPDSFKRAHIKILNSGIDLVIDGNPSNIIKINSTVMYSSAVLIYIYTE